MNKKTLIIVLAILTLGIFIFLYNKNTSIKEKVDNILNKDNEKDSTKAQASISENQMSDADKMYNEAREKYRAIAGDYPPASWSLNQINIWIDEWSDMNKYLSDYASLMAAMQQVSKADANIKNCTSKQEAKILYNNAVEEYKVYKEKYTLYQELSSICKKYNINAEDMGITNINTNTIAEINNAITKANELSKKQNIFNQITAKCEQYGLVVADLGITNIVKNTMTELENAKSLANQLGTLKQKYDTLNKMCSMSNRGINTYINNNKWWNVSLNAYDTYINNEQAMYNAACYSRGKELYIALYNQIKPYMQNYTGQGFRTYRDMPQNCSLDTKLPQQIVEEFKKHNATSKGAMFAGWNGKPGERGWQSEDGGVKLPLYICQSDGLWRIYPSLAAYLKESKDYGSNGHFSNRPGHAAWYEQFDKGNLPFG